MVRNKLAAAILSAGLIVPGLASALGVGDYNLKSYLNQPLELEIELIQTKDLSTEEVLAALASQDEFARAGVERVFFLSDIRFEIQSRTADRMVIVARSSKPVTEPFLNFLMEVQWPQGRLLREYTILLDPPIYKAGAAATATAEPVAAAPVAPVQAPARVVVPSAPVETVDSSLPPAPSGVVAREEPASPAAQTREPSPTARPAAREGDYRVQSGDTMAQIADRFRGAASTQQTMIAIQRANPDAFINGNINLVKKGYVLRIPGEAEVQQISTDEARRDFAAQTRAWRELLDQRAAALPAEGAQLEAGKTAAPKAPAARGTGTGEVTLVAPSASAKSGKAAGGKEAEALQNDLAIAEEGLDKASRENKELASRLGDLDKQVKSSEKLLAVKDDQIAGMQQELNRLRKEKGLEPAEAPQQPAAGDAQSADAAAPAAAADAAAPAAEEKPVVEKKKEKPKKQPKPAAEPDKPSLLLPIAGVLAALLAGGGAFWYLRKKKQSVAAAPAYADEGNVDEQVADDLAQLQDLNLGGDEPGEQHVATDAGETADPLGEADMYMAYGRFQQAADILYAALQREPERADIRVKLAEVYAEMGDSDAAREQASTAAGTGSADVRRQAEAVLARVGGGAVAAASVAAAADEQMPSLDDLALEFSGGKPAAADNDLSFDLSDDFAAPATDVAATAATPAIEDTLDFSLDDYAEPESGSEPAAAASTDFGELSLEDSLAEFTLEDEKPVAAAAAEEFTLEDDLSFEEPAAAPVVDELSLGEDLELEAAPVPAVAEDLADFSFDEPAAAPVVEEAAADLDLESELAELQSDLGNEGATQAAGDDFDFLADSDENATKLDLARAYIDMGDAEGARDILNEVVAEGNAAQKSEAQKLLGQVG